MEVSHGIWNNLNVDPNWLKLEPVRDLLNLPATDNDLHLRTLNLHLKAINPLEILSVRKTNYICIVALWNSFPLPLGIERANWL
jgi:hypothetical protein